jgi:hypothetical protein
VLVKYVPNGTSRVLKGENSIAKLQFMEGRGIIGGRVLTAFWCSSEIADSLPVNHRTFLAAR